VTAPKVTGAENVMLMVVFDAAAAAPEPEAGEKERIESKAA
jgi:hypothetical protein